MGPVPKGFVEAVENGFDYDHSNTEEENRQRMQDEGYCQPELIPEEAFDEWRTKGEKLAFDAAEHQWDLGDWINEGEWLKETTGITRNQYFKHGVYVAGADITGLSVATIKDYAYVARNIYCRRIKTLSFGHHKLIAGLPRSNKSSFYLRNSEVGHLTVGDARRRIRQVLNGAKPKAKPEPKDKADVRAERIVELCGESLPCFPRVILLRRRQRYISP